MQQIFAWQFNKDQDFEDKSEAVVAKMSEIDEVVTKCAPAWPIDQIAQVDLSILRLAVYELLFEKKEPPRVVIDEAVEIGKEFGGPSCASFVNGVLGTVVKDYDLLKENEQHTDSNK